MVVFVGPGGTATNDLLALVQGLAFSGSASGSYVVSGSALSLNSGGITNDSIFGQTVQVPLTLLASATLAANSGSISLTGGLNMGGFGVSVTGSANTAITALTGGGGLFKLGGGTLTLSGTGSYTGGTTINAGRVLVGSASALGSASNALIVNGGTFSTQTFSVSVGALSGGTGGVITTATNAGSRMLTTNVASGPTIFAGSLQNNGSGVLSLTKTGSGMLVLAGANTFSGTTTLSNGVLQLANQNALQNSLLTLSSTTSASLSFDSSVAGNAFTVGGLASSTSAASLALQNTGSAAVALTVGGNNASTTYAGALTGPGSLTKTGSGSLTLSGTNTYTGPTQINAGTVQFTNVNALYGGTTANWTAANLTTGSGATAVFTVGSGATQFTSARLDTLLGMVSTGSTGFLAGSRIGIDTGTAAFSYATNIGNPNGGSNVLGLTKLGSGTLTLSGTNSFTGGVTVTAGRLTAGSALALGDTANSVAVNGGTLDIGTSSVTVGTLSGAAGSVITTATTAGTRTLTTNVASGSAVFAGSIQNSGAGVLALTKDGAGTLVLSGSNTFTGGVTLAGGTLRAGNSLAFGGTTNAVTVSAGTLDTGTFSLSVGALSGSAGGIVTTATNAGTRTLTTNVASGSAVFAGSIQNNGSGVLALTKSGAGTLVLAGSNSYSGSTSITAGALQVGNGGTSGRLATGAVVNSGSLVFSRTDDYGGPVANTISGSGSLTLVGGTLTLSGSNSYTGGTTLSAGSLLAGNVSAFGSSSSPLAIAGGTVNLQTFSATIGALTGSAGGVITTAATAGTRTLTTFVASGSAVFAGSMQDNGSGVLALTKAGAGTLVLSGSNAYTGSTTVAGGALQVGNGGTTGAIGSGTVVNNGSLVFSRSDAYGGPVGTVITGSGAMTISGGSLTLTATSSFSGPTAINAGSLQVNGSLASSAVTVNAGGQLGGSGAVGSLTVNAGGTLLPGNSPGLLTAGDVIFNGGGSYNWQLANASGTAGVHWDLLAASGSLTINATTGNPFAVNLWTLSGTGPDTNGQAANFNQYTNQSWTIGTFAGGISGFAPNLFSLVTGSANGTGGFANPFAGTFSITSVGNNLNVLYTAPALAAYDYSGGTGSFSAGANWSLGAPPMGTPAITFSGAGGTATNDLLSAVTGLAFTGSASGAYVVAGSSLAVGAGGVTNDSTFTQTVQSPISLTAAGSVAANAGGLVLSGGVATGGYGLTVAGAADTTITTVAGAGGLVKNGAGTLTLSGSSSFTGGVTLAAGRLVTGDPLALGGTANALTVNAGTLDVGTTNLTIGALTGSAGGVITTAATAGTRTLTTFVASGSAVFAGSMQDNGAGVLALTKAGAGTLVLSGSSSATGGITLAAGTVQMGHPAALGGTTSPLAVNAGTLNVGLHSLSIGALSGSAGGVITTGSTVGTRTLTTNVASGISVFAGSIQNSGSGVISLSKAGAGTLVLSGSNTFTGGVTLAGGTLRAGNSLAFGGTTNALTVNAGTLDTGTFSLAVGALSGSAGGVITTAATAGTRTLTTNVAAGSAVFAGSIQNSGSGVMALTKTGAGTLVLAGGNTYSGTTSITAGALQVGDGGTSGRLGTGAVVNSGSLVFNRTDDYGGPVANAISGSGSLTLARGTLTLSGSTSFTGDTRASSGTLALAHARALGGSTLDLNAADTGIVTLSGTGVQTYSLGGLKGPRNLDIGANSLSVGGNNQSGTYSGAITGSGGLVKTGFGSLTLTGSNAYAGATTISGGTLQVGNGGFTGTLSGSVVINNATLAFNRIDGYGGPLPTAISGSGSLRLLSGSLTLSGNNGYTGSTTITSGMLQVGDGGASGRLGTGPITNTALLVFNRSDDYGGPIANSINGTGALQALRGTLVFTGSNNSTGSTTITGGTLQVGNGGTSGRLGGGAITNNGALVFKRIDGYGGTITNVISGSGSLTVASGSLTLSAANSYTGGTRVANGVLAVANSNALAQSTLDMDSTDAGTVVFSASVQPYYVGGLSGARNLSTGSNNLWIGGNGRSTSYSGVISGFGSTWKTGTGTLTLTGSAMATGSMAVSGGRLVGNTTNLPREITNNSSTLEFAQATSGTFAGRVNNVAAGTALVVKSGSGTLALTGTVSSGILSVDGGRVVTTATNVSNVQVVANATVEFAQNTSGSLTGWLSGTGALLKSGSGTLTLQNGGFTGTTTVTGGRLAAPAATIRGPIVNDAAFEFTQSLNGEYASVLSGSGSLTKSGSGTLTLSGSSLATGLTTISAGMLATGGAERLADTSTVSISSGASLRLGGNETIGMLLGSGSVNLQAFQLTIAGSGSSTYSGNIFGSGGLSKAGSGILTLGGTNGFLGATNLNMGTLVLSSSASLSPFTTLSIAAGSTLILNRDVRVFAYTNSGGTISGTGRLLTSSTAATGGTLTSLADVSGTDAYSVGLLKTSTATLVVSGSTSFTGGVVVEQGIVKLDAGGSFAASNVVDVRGGAKLDLNGQSQTVSALAGSGSVALGGGTLTVDATKSTTFSGAIAGGSLVKSGSSALSLTGSATVSTASVTSGLMSVNGTLTGTVSVAPGGTLGGAGTIIGAVAVSGTHTPGNSPDVSTIMGNLAYATGATVVWEIAANEATQGQPGGRVFDQIVVSGDLVFSGSTSVALSFFDQDPNSTWTSTVDWTNAFWSSNRAWKIYQVSGTTTGFGNLSLRTESWLDSNGVAFMTALPAGSFALSLEGSDVMLVYSVPEPEALALAAAGVAASSFVLRRRRQQRNPATDRQV